jgi:imidazolonepropionase-like amidohydrolase
MPRSDGARLKLTGCTIVDARAPTARSDQEIHIVGERIDWVGDAKHAPPFADARRVDLAGSWVVPGLGDAHVHLSFLDPHLPSAANVPANLAYCLEHARRAIREGFTMLRVVGGAAGVDAALRDLFDRGDVVGPRIWAAGELLTPTGGHMADRFDFWGVRVCDGVDGWRQGARAQFQAGADHIKAVITGGAIGAAHDVTDTVTVTEEELAAAADVAASHGKPLVVHAAASAGVAMAVRAGARSVEHGYYLDEKAVRLLADSRTWLTPTLSVTHQIPAQLRDDYERATFAANGMAAWVLQRREERYGAQLASFQLALRAGVRMLAGSDFAPLPGASHCELAFLVRAGMTPWQAIVAATQSFAEVVGAAADLGTIEAGKFADLIAVEGDPLDDIRHLRLPILVMRGGAIAHQTGRLEAPAKQMVTT